MTDRREFHPLQAQEIACAFNEKGVDYLFIGKSGAILLGFPGTTQDVDIFPARDIIASKRASGRQRDELDLPLLESFRAEYEKAHAPQLRSAADVAAADKARSP